MKKVIITLSRFFVECAIFMVIVTIGINAWGIDVKAIPIWNYFIGLFCLTLAMDISKSTRYLFERKF